jgi:hypothetical protein
MRNKHLMLVVLAACVLIAMIAIASAHSRFHTHDLQHQGDSPEEFSLPCLVLTLNESNIDLSAKKCKPFVAPSFTEAELDFVAPEAREKILHPHLLTFASDLSNTASVNIYINHARIWRHVVAHWDVALVLEEDIVVPPHADVVIAQVLAALRRANTTNYVVKLQDLSSTYHSWTPQHIVDGRELRECLCRPSMSASGSAAYMLDRAAAHTLLRHAFPASMHVDIYMHHLGCMENRVRLLGLNPNLMITSKSVTHVPHDWRRKYLLFKEMITNFMYSTC